jgi:uncharacterized membrane protein
MSTRYNTIAGRSLPRLAALSDGIFAVAMTLMVLELHTPVESAIHSEHELLTAIGDLWPNLLTYLMSFLTLGIFWIGQQTELDNVQRTDRNLTWIHLAFLGGIALMPFWTALLNEFITYRLALVFYWANLVLLGTALFASWRYAQRAGLLVEEVAADPLVVSAIERRIIVAQTLYAVAVALCVINTYVSIAILVLLQIDSVVAPRFGLLRRI